MAGIHSLIILNVVFEVLDNLDSQVEVVLGVAENKLTYVLALIGALLNYVAVVLEKVVYEEFIELSMRAVGILIDLSGKSLAENECVDEAARDRLQLSQEHQQISVENCQLVSTLVQSLDYQVNL